MRDFPREKLRELIAQYGVSLCEDPIRCEGLLSDSCGGYKKEVFILVCALKQRVPAALLTFSGWVPIELIMIQITERLHGDLSIDKPAARWGVESWALALGMIESPPVEYTSIRESKWPKVTSLTIGSRIKKSNTKAFPRMGPRDNDLVKKVGVMLSMLYLGFVIGLTCSTIYLLILRYGKRSWSMARAFLHKMMQQNKLF